MKKVIGLPVLIAMFLSLGYTIPTQALAFDDETNKKVIKDAVVGAVTGYVAVAATSGDQKASTIQTSTTTTSAESTEKSKHAKKDKCKEGHRPPGWDKGKKTGWDGKDVPPGQAKK